MTKQMPLLLSLLALSGGFAGWYFTFGPGQRDKGAEPWYSALVWGRYKRSSIVVPTGLYKGKRLKIGIRSRLKGKLAAFNFPEGYAKHIPTAHLNAFIKTTECSMLRGTSPSFSKKLKASLANPKYGLSPSEQRKKWKQTIAWLRQLRKRTIESFLKGTIYFRYKFGKPDHEGQCAYSYKRVKLGKRLLGYIRLRETSFRAKRGLCALRYLPSTIFHEMLHVSWPVAKAYPPIPQFSVYFRLKQWRKGNPNATKSAAQLALSKFNGGLEEALVTQLEKACLSY